MLAPILLFFAAATVAVQLSRGPVPALFVALLALPAAYWASWPGDLDDLNFVVSYVWTTALLMALVHELRRAQARSVRFAEIAESRHRQLLGSEAEIAALEAQLERQ